MRSLRGGKIGLNLTVNPQVSNDLTARRRIVGLDDEDDAFIFIVFHFAKTNLTFM